jgi:hypothetical protein
LIGKIGQPIFHPTPNVKAGEKRLSSLPHTLNIGREKDYGKGDAMSLASFYFLMFVISVFSLITWGILKFFLKRFGHAEYVRNEINGVIAIAKRDDFVRARRNTKPGERVKVENTLLFWSRNANSWIDKDLTIGNGDLVYDLDIYEEWDSSLFVPFVSNQEMKMVDQMKFFHRFTLEEAREYVSRKSPYLIRTWRRMARWYDRSWDGRGLSCSLWLLCFIFFVGLLLALSTANQKEHRYTFTAHTSATDPTLITHSEKFPIAASDEFSGGKLFEYTITKDPIHIGGGLVSVEGMYNDDGSETAVRASATLNLKKGDVVTVRNSQVMNKKNQYMFEAWVITQEEAQKLVASGEFRLVGKK